MPITPVTPARLVHEIAEMVLGRVGRVRLVVDGAPPTRPVVLAREVATELRASGRAAVVVDAGDFLRPASVRLEFGREDPDEFLDGWLDVAGLRREVLDPGAADGTGRVLPRLWNAAADRAHRDDYTIMPADGVTIVAGALLLGRGLPVELAVHLRMSRAALGRTIPVEQRWTLPAYTRYATDTDPENLADLIVLADHPDRPAIRR